MHNQDPFICENHRFGAEPKAWTRFRHAALYTVGFGCLVLGMVLIITLVRLETLQTLTTAELSAIVGFLALPMLTLLSLRYDRSAIKASTARDYVYSQAEYRVAHSAHDRGARIVRHARVNESSESAPPPRQQTNAPLPLDAA